MLEHTEQTNNNQKETHIGDSLKLLILNLQDLKSSSKANKKCPNLQKTTIVLLIK
jgi:hypothetical protein